MIVCFSSSRQRPTIKPTQNEDFSPHLSHQPKPYKSQAYVVTCPFPNVRYGAVHITIPIGAAYSIGLGPCVPVSTMQWRTLCNSTLNFGSKFIFCF